MKLSKLVLIALIAMTFSVSTATAQKKYKGHPKPNGIPADLALTGIPMDMTPDQLPDQFRTQLRGDVSRSKGIAILKQNGEDVEYTFAWWGVTSPVIQAHFHYGPHDQVGARAFSICGVANDSPPCPSGTRNSISGVWKNADLSAIRGGDIVIAFHTRKYPAPTGEFAVYVPSMKMSK